MLHVNKINIEGYDFLTYEVELPKTTLFIVSYEKVGYIMCAALDIDLEAPLAKVTVACDRLGIKPGMIGKDALVLMAKSLEK